MMPIQALVFDLYGTLFDVHSVAQRCEERVPGRGREISLLWRQKQLEYTWLRSLMDRYVDFEQATADALAYVDRSLALALGPDARADLCAAYLRLSPFPDVPGALRELKTLGLPLAILSNGSTHTIDTVVAHAGLADAFDHLISVDRVRTFKPHGRVYELAEQTMGVPRAAILFVSSNPWDATGAGCFGYRTCWVDRGATYDELGRSPDHVVTAIAELPALIASLEAR